MLEQGGIKMMKVTGQAKYWLAGVIGGPGISVILQFWIIKNPSEKLVGFIYLLGFIIYALVIVASFKLREKQIDFLKYMVHTHEEEIEVDGKKRIKDFGRIDSNSVEIVKILKEWMD